MSLSPTLATSIRIPFEFEDPNSKEGKEQAQAAAKFPESKAVYKAALSFQKSQTPQNADFVNRAIQAFVVATVASGSISHPLITPGRRVPCSLANCRKLWEIKAVPSGGGRGPEPASPTRSPASPVVSPKTSPIKSPPIGGRKKRGTVLPKGSVKFHALRDLPQNFKIKRRGSTYEGLKLGETLIRWLQTNGQGVLAKMIQSKNPPNLHSDDLEVWSSVQAAVCAKVLDVCDPNSQAVGEEKYQTHADDEDVFLKLWSTLMDGYSDSAGTRSQLAQNLEEEQDRPSLPKGVDPADPLPGPTPTLSSY